MLRLNQTVRLGLAVLIYLSTAAAWAHTRPGQAHTKGDSCEDRLEGLFIINDAGVLEGITKTGLDRITKAQTALVHNTTNLNYMFEGLSGVIDMDLIAMTGKQNVMVGGEGGGAKTGLVKALIPKRQLWTGAQFNEMTSLSDIFGNFTEEGFQRGLNIRNREGSATEFPYALFDEWANSSASTIGGLLSFLQPEERDQDGYRGQTRSVFLTGNASLSDLMKEFNEVRFKSGAAVLNRGIFKAWVTNWLTPDEQYRRDQVIKRMRFLKSMADGAGTQAQAKAAQAELQKIQSQEMDMDAIQKFGEHAFVMHKDLESAIRKFENRFREEMRKLERASAAAHKKDPIRNPLVRTPSADWTERLRGWVPETIVYYAALDYLRMAGPKALEALRKPIVLGPMSLWRAMYIATTIGPGENRFNPLTMQIDFNLTKNSVPELVPWDHKIALDGAKNDDQKNQLEFMWEEQRMMNGLLHEVHGILSSSAKEMAPWMKQKTVEDEFEDDDANVDFELKVAKHLHHTRPLGEEVEEANRKAAEAAAQAAEAPAAEQK